MIEAELFDGTVLEFPEGTPPEVVQNTVKTQTERLRSAAPQGQAAGPRDPATVQSEFDAMPWYRQLPQAADDIVRLGLDGASFGYMDKLAGYLDGTGAAPQRALTEEARTRAGLAGTVADIGGAILGPGKVLKAGGVLPSLAKGVTGTTGALGRAGLAGVEGAGYGVLSATGHDTDPIRGAVTGAAFGAAGQALGEAASGAVDKVAGAFNKKPQIPTYDEIKAAKTAAYDAADNSGVIFTPDAMTKLRDTVTSKLADMGYDPALQPGAATVLRRLEDFQGQNVTVKGLDTLRKVAGNGFDPMNKGNNEAVRRIINSIDEAVSSPQTGDVLTGNAQVAAEAYPRARELYSRTAKADDVQAAVERAKLNASSSGSGMNEENTTRQALKSLLLHNKSNRFTPDETEALKQAVFGTTDQNVVRWLGKLAPTGTVSTGMSGMTGAAVGSLFGSPFVGAAAAPVIGLGARRVALETERKNVDKLMEIILSGGTRAGAEAPPNAVQEIVKEYKDPIMRAIFAASQNKAKDAAANLEGR